ncbi:MAG: SDR family NAD(P)-dependent oxidoreductase [Gemmatimonadota bacterium]|nr:SDR family NAD(P)-dependent oxidoreductase [Gemmatimonadota bacterium]
MELDDRVAVVTGASTGIGRAVATALGEAGCNLAICARTRSDLEEAAGDLRDTSAPRVLAMTCDVSDPEEVAGLAEGVLEELGPPDVLVNNAGIGVFGRFQDLSLEDFDHTFGVNVRGTFLCSRAFVPSMVAAGGGVIVNIASLAGKNVFASGSIYAASKHAVLGMSKCMMLDLRDEGIRVLTVCPGSVDTPFFEKQDHMTPERSKILSPEDVAELVLTAIRLSDRGTVSEVEIRPVNP